MIDLCLSVKSLMSNRTKFSGLFGWTCLKFGPVFIGLAKVILLYGTWSPISLKFELKNPSHNLGANLKKKFLILFTSLN